MQNAEAGIRLNEAESLAREMENKRINVVNCSPYYYYKGVFDLLFN